MAENSEERKVRIVLDAMQATASAKEMGAGLAILRNQLEKVAEDDPNRAKLQDDFARLNQRLTATRAEMRAVIQTEEELAEAQRKLVAENREVILNGQKVHATFNDMKAAAGLLEKELHELSDDDPGRAKMLKDYRALQDRIEGVKKEMGEAADQGLTFKDALAFAGVTVGAEAALDMIKELGAEVIETTKEFGKMRADINGLTGATGTELDELTVGVRGLAQTFGKEYDEVLVASNSLSKQMGISQKEALRLIEQGFLSGADASGEFLDQVKEYPAQFKAAGLSANQAIGLISQSVTTGVFSDKGADVIKEFGIKISEQTKSTSDAMQAAFGDKFTKEIFDGINNGSMTSAQALQRVAQQMDETKIPANQLQTVIADVFGGPGEDAGLDYIKSLKNVAKGVDEMVDKTNGYTQQQIMLLASNKELAAAQNDLAQEFEGSGTVMQTLSNQAMTVLYTMLASLAATWKELVKPVQEVWSALLELGESMGWVSKEGTTAKGVGEMLGNVIHWMLTPTRLLWGILADVTKATVEWAKSSDNARGYLQLMTSPIRALYDLLTNGPAYFAGFSAAAESSFGTIGRAWQKIKNRDFSGAASEFGDIGKNAGDAYSKAFNQAMDQAAWDKLEKTRAPSDPKEKDKEKDKSDAGGDGTTKADRDKAAAAAAKERLAEQKQRDQERQDATKEWVKEEGQQLDYRNTLAAQVEQKGFSDELLRRREQQQKLMDAATAQANKLTGKELDYTEQLEAIVEARDLALRELRAKFDAEDEKARQEAIDKKIVLDQAEEEKRLAELDLKLANGTLSEWAYQDAIFAVKQAALEREMALVKEKSGEESAEYQKLATEKIKNETDYTAKKKSLGEGQNKFETALNMARKVMNSEEVNTLMESLGKKTVLYKAAQALQKTLAIAEIGMSVPKQWAANSEAGAKISAMAPPFTVPLGVAYTVATNALSTAGAAAATAKILGFREGGRTGTAQIGPSGKLLDEQGYPIAGVVHENEYVIPEWLRKDPEVVQVEQWLEAKRQRGFREGGATSDEAAPAAGRQQSVATDAQLVAVLGRLDSRLGRVEEWATNLKVWQHTGELADDLAYVKKVQDAGGIS